MEISVSITDHVFMVSQTVMPKYSLTSQNPASLTCEKNRDPAPTESTTSGGADTTRGDDGCHDCLLAGGSWVTRQPNAPAEIATTVAGGASRATSHTWWRHFAWLTCTSHSV